MSFTDGEESLPLLESTPKNGQNGHFSYSQERKSSKNSKETSSKTDIVIDNSGIQIKKTITLPVGIGILVGCCTGTGIFISPTGVTENAGSVGLSLIIWVVCGLFNMVLALCYAELGTAMPVAGGDYAYIEHLLGPFPAFLCLWVMVFLTLPCAIALISRTAATYLALLLGLDCSVSFIMVAASVFIFLGAALNIFSVKISSWVSSAFSFGKILAMAIIIITGIVKLAQGHTEQFTNIWEGSHFDVVSIILAFVPGFVTFGGWDAVCNVAEEMENPSRDLPLMVVSGLLLVTGSYFLTNVAYFSMLTPAEFLSSGVVATSFSDKALPGVTWLVPVFVIVSALGSTFSIFLVGPRSTFAGGRNGQIPEVFSFLSIVYATPIPAIIMLLVLTMLFLCMTFLDLVEILDILGLFTECKITLALCALIYLKYRREDLKPSIRVNIVVVVLCIVILTTVIGVSVYSSPSVMGLGFVLFILGIPFYLASKAIGAIKCYQRLIAWFTIVVQQLWLVVPEDGAQRKKE